MSNPFIGKNQFRFPLALLLVAIFAALSVSLLAQNETAARDAWQRPNEVMDSLSVKAGSAVADIGAGGGYFTFHLAERVGPSGKVYAEDILQDRIADIRARAQKENLPQIQTIVGAPDDPHLPVATLDAILVVNAYHEMRDYDAMLQAMFKALKPGGFLGIIDAPAQPGGSRESYYAPHRIPKELVQGDATRNGFRFVREQPGFTSPEGGRNYFFLIFEKP